MVSRRRKGVIPKQVQPIRPGDERGGLTEWQHSFALTTREMQVASALLRRLSYREIAEELGISYHTVNAHAKAVYSKMQVRSARELRAVRR